MTLPPRAEFGLKRVNRPKVQTANGRAGSRFIVLDRLMGAEPREPGEPYRIVPIRLVPILWAAAGLLVLHIVDYEVSELGGAAVGFLTNTPTFGRASPSDIAQHGATIGWAFMGLVPVFVFLFWTTGHFAAIYAIGAQVPLRWLRWTSPLAFCLGGAASAYLLTAINALGGGHVTVESLVVAILGGAVSGFLYRKAAGLIPAGEPRRGGTATLKEQGLAQ
jgi:hypothetical protein